VAALPTAQAQHDFSTENRDATQHVSVTGCFNQISLRNKHISDYTINQCTATGQAVNPLSDADCKDSTSG
jgi:hypothetical protein